MDLTLSLLFLVFLHYFSCQTQLDASRQTLIFSSSEEMRNGKMQETLNMCYMCRPKLS